MKQIEYKHINKIKIGFNKQQWNSIQTLKKYGVNINQFIRQAMKEKIERDWKCIKESKIKIDNNYPSWVCE